MTTTIITNGIVITCDPKNRAGRLTIVVDDGRIREVSERGDNILRENPHATVIDAAGKLIVPGFINAHHHGASVLLQEATRGLHFSMWDSTPPLGNAVMKLLHESSRDDIRRIYRACYHAHLRCGVTTVGEFPPPLEDQGFTTMLEAIASTHVNAVVTLQNWDQIRHVQSLRSRTPRCAVSLGEENEFTVYSFENLNKAAKDLRVPLLAHIAETKEDVEEIRRNFQRDAITILGSFNLLNPETIIIHANHITDEEVKMLKAVGNIVVVTPHSTAAKQTGYPSIRSLARHHLPLALGTDWGSGGIVEEMRFLHQLPMLVPGLRSFPAAEILRMATINGAAALNLLNESGSIEAGKNADLVFFDTANARTPALHKSAAMESYARLVVDHLSSGDIVDVMIKGVMRVQGRALTGADETGIVNEFNAVHGKFFANPLTAPVQENKSDVKTNVLPFVPERVNLQEQQADYATGFPAEQGSTPVHDINDKEGTEEHPFPHRKKPSREPIKPELPKNIRRVFGEDDDLE